MSSTCRWARARSLVVYASSCSRCSLHQLPQLGLRRSAVHLKAMVVRPCCGRDRDEVSNSHQASERLMPPEKESSSRIRGPANRSDPDGRDRCVMMCRPVVPGAQEGRHIAPTCRRHRRSFSRRVRRHLRHSSRYRQGFRLWVRRITPSASSWNCSASPRGNANRRLRRRLDRVVDTKLPRWAFRSARAASPVRKNAVVPAGFFATAGCSRSASGCVAFVDEIATFGARGRSHVPRGDIATIDQASPTGRARMRFMRRRDRHPVAIMTAATSFAWAKRWSASSRAFRAHCRQACAAQVSVSACGDESLGSSSGARRGRRDRTRRHFLAGLPPGLVVAVSSRSARDDVAACIFGSACTRFARRAGAASSCTSTTRHPWRCGHQREQGSRA